MRKSVIRAEVASDQSETQSVYPRHDGVETDHKCGLIASQSGNNRNLSEDILGFLRTIWDFIAELDLDSIFPPILRGFLTHSQGLRVAGPIGD